jgi:hypothetical protein
VELDYGNFVGRGSFHSFLHVGTTPTPENFVEL